MRRIFYAALAVAVVAAWTAWIVSSVSSDGNGAGRWAQRLALLARALGRDKFRRSPRYQLNKWILDFRSSFPYGAAR